MPEPPKLPDGYPYDADSATKRAFLISKAPKLTTARREALRELLRPSNQR